MTTDPTKKELELAERVNDLGDAAARPVVAGGGLLSAAANFLMRRVSRGIMTAALTVFITYHGWEAFNGSLQAMADLQSKRAEAGTAIAEANALNAKTGGSSLALASMKAELEKVQQQAAALQAEADAQNAMIGDATVKLRTLRAEIDKTKADAQTAKVEADAEMQMIGNTPANVAQKKAEVETLEQKVRSSIEGHHLMVQMAIDGIRRGKIFP
jgi:vacuolar-type H+-ATPase subunit I/STV1